MDTLPDQVVRRLLSQSFLFDDPASYEAGVRDALEAINAAAREAEAGETVGSAVA